MINKLKELPETTSKLLQFAACIGNQFNIDLLSRISKLEPESVLVQLQEALKEGYILGYGEAYRAVSYHFAHDRIQQAAHSMLNDEEKREIHINLARLILKSTSDEKLDKIIFNIANHYNIGIESTIRRIH